MAEENLTLSQIKDKIFEMGKCFNEIQELHKTYPGKLDALTSDVKEAKEKLTEDFSAKHELIQRELDAIKARESRPQVDTKSLEREGALSEWFAKQRRGVQEESVKSGNAQGFPGFESTGADYRKYTKAFWKAVRTSNMGDRGLSFHALSEDERKDMAVGSDPDGGYFLAPPTISQTVVQRIFETSPMRQLASTRTIGTREYIVPEDPSDVGVGWVTERQPRTSTQTVNPSRKVIPAQEEYAEPVITQQLLEDAMFDVEAYLIERLTDKFNRWENTAFVNGSGVGQPRGFMTYPTINVNGADWYFWGNYLEQINSGSSGEFTYLGLTRLITSLKENFQSAASFLIKRQSLYGILNITDSNGRLIFQPILNGNFNNTPLLGYPLRYATDMPNASNLGSPVAAVNAMAFGDFGQGYQIVDRVGLSMIRDNITVKGSVLLYTRKRVGGDVVNFDAIKLLSLQ